MPAQEPTSTREPCSSARRRPTQQGADLLGRTAARRACDSISFAAIPDGGSARLLSSVDQPHKPFFLFTSSAYCAETPSSRSSNAFARRIFIVPAFGALEMSFPVGSFRMASISFLSTSAIVHVRSALLYSKQRAGF